MNVRRLLSRAAPLLAVAAFGMAAVAGATACKTHYDFEDKETPVEVILVAPGAEKSDVTLPVLVYVGDHKAIDRTVRFPAGTTRISTPLLYLRAGEPTVSVVLQGRAVATERVRVRQPTWIVVTIESPAAATIKSSGQDPTTAR
jgi:hypothetical protein